ncbi:MAG: PAS domain-containing protein [Betaproteobacteria bacterium]
MNDKIDWIEKRRALRTDSEKLLATVISPEMQTKPTEILLHELAVHKIELEMQIEELRSAHIAMEEARDRYVDFFDFAPIGYASIGREGLISEINLAAATMLGADRGELVGRRFSLFVSPDGRDRWHRLFMAIMNQAGSESRAVVLDLMHTQASSFRVFADCRRREPKDAPPELRLTLIDIRRIREAEAEMTDTPADPGPSGK